MCLYCKYCNRECKNDNSLRNHERLCKLNPNHQDIMSYYVGFREYNRKLKDGSITKDTHYVKRKPSNRYIKAREEGREPPKISEETRRKISEKSKLKRHSPEERAKISRMMKNIVEEHPESYCSKNISKLLHRTIYNGYKMDSGWELIVAKYLDSQQIEWNKPKTFFIYQWNDDDHRYFPDFYLPKYDVYIEVKGYERERDRAKYKVVPNLIVIKRAQITSIERGEYNIFDIITQAK